MKLFLASSLDGTAELLQETLSIPLKGARVLFSANAADKHKGDKWWVASDREAFVRLGCEIVDVDLRSTPGEQLKERLDNVQILHFCGGSVLYLISLIKEKQLDSVIKDYVKSEKIIYTGTSAGSMIAADDLALCVHDPEELDYIDVKKVKDFKGLGLVKFLILPHCNNQGFVEANKKMVENMAKENQPLIFIYDNQAVYVENDDFKVVTK